jgi:hypothetical protein
VSEYSIERKKLVTYLNGIYDILVDNNAIIAGGCITSLFTNREINDVDVYFKDKNSLINACIELNNCCTIVNHTNKAILMKHSDVNIQLIAFKFFDNAKQLFDSFDFTVCMGAYNCNSEKFILDKDFLKHNSQRILQFNENTSFPLISALRVDKYIKKGYKISKADYIKILLACNKLKINSYEELKEHVGGMYGENYDKIFDDTKDFSIDNALNDINILKENSINDSNYFKFRDNDNNDLSLILSTILKTSIVVPPSTMKHITPNNLKDLGDFLNKFFG